MAKRTNSEFEIILKEQIHFLKKCNLEFDKGDQLEAIRIAGHLRTLLHQTQNSTALLELLGIRESLTLYDTCMPKGTFGGFRIGSNTHNLTISNVPNSFYAGLLCKELQGNENTINVFEYSAWIEPSHLRNKISFADWWDNNIVFDDNLGNKLTRSDLICLVANKDGYSHVAEKLPTKYSTFKNNTIVKININGKIMNPNNIPIYPAVRQISFEFISSLFELYPQFNVL
jgi:hypothetical protein